MSAWYQDGEDALDDDTVGPAWQHGHHWAFDMLDGNDNWDNDTLHARPATTTAPPRNTFQTHNSTIFPPPHAFRATSPQNSQTQSVRRNPRAATHSRPSPGSWTASTDTNQPPRFGYIVDHLFDSPAPALENSIPSAFDYSTGFEVLEESSSELGANELESADMARETRRRGSDRPSRLVSLTAGSSSGGTVEQSMRRGVKRPAESSTEGRSKRRAHEAVHEGDYEEINLTEEAPSAEEELRQQQQKEAIRAQQAAQKDQEPQRVGQRQCIICMDNYTDATVTSCGHFFCHECLTQALIAGEKNSERGVGTCPVCRKTLSRKKKNEIIPIAFMKKEQFAKNQSKRTDIIA